MIKPIPKYKFGDIVTINNFKFVIVGVIIKIKHIYYEIVCEDHEYVHNDCDFVGVNYETIREDRLC